jgi:hypothetical protein
MCIAVVSAARGTWETSKVDRSEPGRDHSRALGETLIQVPSDQFVANSNRSRPRLLGTHAILTRGVADAVDSSEALREQPCFWELLKNPGGFPDLQ